MGKRKNNQKASDPSAPFKVPPATAYPVTLSRRTSGWTEAGKEYLSKAEDFCGCVRTIVNRLINGKPYLKAELQSEYDLSSRLYNSAEVCAKGDFESVKAAKWLAYQTAKRKYWLAIGSYVKGYCQGMDRAEEVRILSRIGKWRRKMEKQEATLDHPSYFPGRDVYENQQRMSEAAFAKAYHEARNNRIMSVGTWEEGPCCNSELQVRFNGYANNGLVTVGYNFSLFHGGEELCQFNLPRKEGCQLLHRLEQNGVPYRYEASYRALSKAELNDADPAFIGPLGVGYFKKVREDYYVPLTVMLLRDKKHPNRWQVRVSWLQPGPKSYETGNTFLSYDTNNDSLAYTLFRIKDGKLELLHKAEVFFEKQAPNGKDRERRLHEELNLMFDLALKHQACVVGEALNWEGAKTGFSAISKSLHNIPYGRIYDAVVRKGLLHGVPVRFINPAYTSVLGGLFTDLNRDKAAALVIGLKGSHQGIDLLETLCQKFLDQDLPNGGIRYKVEVKNRFSEIVKVKEVPSCQLDRQGATAASRLSYLLVDVLRHRKKLHRRLRHGEKLSTVVLLDDIGPTARPGKRRRPTIRRPKVKVEQELTIQS